MSSSAAYAPLHTTSRADTLTGSTCVGTPEPGVDAQSPLLWKRVEEREGTASMASSIANITNTIIGTGMLAMPSALASTGIFPGVAAILFCACTASFGLYLLSLCAKRVPNRHSSFNAIAQITYPSAAIFFDGAIALKCFGVSISYLLILGELVPQVIISFYHVLTPEGVEPPDFLLDRRAWITLFVVLLAPLCFLRDLHALRHTSYVSIFAASYLVLIVVVCAFHSPVPIPNPGKIELGRLHYSAIAKFPVLVFAFTCAQNLFPVYNELADNSQARISTVIGASVGTAACLYELIGVLGYITFGDGVTANIMAMYPDRSLFIAIGRVAIAVLVLFSYPLQVHPCRSSLDKVITLQKPTPDPDSGFVIRGPPSKTKHGAVTIGILFSTWAVAMVVRELDKVLAFVGSTGSTTISFILPGVFYFALARNDPKAWWLKWAALALAVYGVLVMLFCLSFNVYHLVVDGK